MSNKNFDRSRKILHRGAKTSAYHPQTNRTTERFNRTFDDMVSKYISTKGNDWDLITPMVVSAYNNTEHKTTKEIPYFLIFGREPRTPIDAMLSNH